MARFKYYDGTNWVELSPSTHTHGNITNGGKITATAVTSASGIVVIDSNNLIQRVTDMSSFRTIIGAGTSNLALANSGGSNGSATTAARSDHTHSYLSTSGGTLSANTTPILTLKRSATSSGAFVSFKSNNQDAKIWYAGQDSSNNFRISYSSDSGSNSTKELELDTSGNLAITGTISEGGQTLSNKYQAKGTYAGTSTATQSANGLMSSTDKTKLDGIAANATANVGTVTSVNSVSPTSGNINVNGFTVLTSAPTSANTSGITKVVVLSSEPSTKYSGYIYIITN